MNKTFYIVKVDGYYLDDDYFYTSDIQQAFWYLSEHQVIEDLELNRPNLNYVIITLQLVTNE